MPDSKPPEPRQIDVKTPEQLRQAFLIQFSDFRTKYSNEILNQKDFPTTPNLELYKCRLPFFLLVVSRANYLVQRAIITDSAVCKAFETFTTKLGDRQIVKEDIDRLNEFLDYIIAELKK